MSTYMAKKGDLERKWYVLDAAGKPLGKTAVAAADLLRGKTKPEYLKETEGLVNPIEVRHSGQDEEERQTSYHR